jgi:hypothetical protein
MTLLAKVALCLAIVLGAIGAFLLWLADPLYLKAPNDNDLLIIFHNNRSAFEKLCRMATEDSESYISESNLDVKLSGERRQEYKSLLSGIHSGLIVTTSTQSVRFIFANGGLSAIGPEWLKGIEYLPKDVAREGTVVKDLDHPALLATGGVYLRLIEPAWFLILQKTD